MNNKDNSFLYIIGGLILIVGIGGGIYFVSMRDSEEPNEVPTNTQQEDTEDAMQANRDSAEPPSEDSELTMILEYADGSYSATGSYQSPAGPEEIEVVLDLENGIITSVEVTPQATNPASVKWQGEFSRGVADVVVGQNIADVDYPGVINGSSLTGRGFANALEQIKQEAAS